MTEREGNDQSRAAPTGGSLIDAPPQAVGEVLGLLTHDLRNPLAALSSNVGFLKMVCKDLSGDAAEALEDLLISVEAMERIVDAVELVGHDFQRRALPAACWLFAGSTASALEPPIARGAKSHNVDLVFDIQVRPDVAFFASEAPFKRALSSLLHNAIIVSPQRAVVTLRVTAVGDELEFAVFDEGPQLSEAMVAELRSVLAHSRMKTERASRYSRGLGLYCAVRSADLAGVDFRLGESISGSCLKLVAARRD